LVGLEEAAAGEKIAALVAFLDPDRQRERCKPGVAFELREGDSVTGEGIIESVALRPNDDRTVD
jgi:hypothetical protein